jgi:pimeloyl-ACP methyl ester carboxylesterase
MKRLLLLPGYLEDGTIFDTLRPLLPPAPVEVIELVPALTRWQPRGPVSAATLAQYLAKRHAIGPADMVVGHSMGGWIAAHIKAETGAAAVLLSSFTDQRKVVAASRNPLLLRLYAYLGLGRSRWLRARATRQYQFEESRALYTQVADGLVHISRRHVHRQLQVLFVPVPPLTVEPELRVHARADNVVLPPDEPFLEIAGDHFAHFYHPAPVAAAISRIMS